jgi:hypothetical protein
LFFFPFVRQRAPFSRAPLVCFWEEVHLRGTFA